LASALIYLRKHILSLHPEMKDAWKYSNPFFVLKGKNFCYFWKDKTSGLPYIGLMEGRMLDHPALIDDGRKRIKILLFDPAEDLKIELIDSILNEMITHY